MGSILVARSAGIRQARRKADVTSNAMIPKLRNHSRLSRRACSSSIACRILSNTSRLRVPGNRSVFVFLYAPSILDKAERN